MQATHFIEQYRQRDRVTVVSSSIQDIKKLEANLNLTKASGMKTIAIWKIKLKPGVTMPQPE